MARTALYAPAHRVAPRQPPGASAPAANAAPSLDYLGSGIQDHRLAWNSANSSTGAQAIGWAGNHMKVTGQVPSTIAAANIVASANATAATLVLVTSSAAGITVVPAGGFLCLPSQNTIPAGALCIDGLPTYNRFGSSDITAFYSPGAGISRCVSVTAAASATATSATISGWDYYGYPMTSTQTVTASATTNSLKAFKFIGSVVLNAADASHAYSVGTADIFGFNLLTSLFSSALIFWNETLITANTGFVVPDTTNPATAATGDVRGTYAVQSASDGTKRLNLFTSIGIGNVLTNPTTGLFGQAQV